MCQLIIELCVQYRVPGLVYLCTKQSASQQVSKSISKFCSSSSVDLGRRFAFPCGGNSGFSESRRSARFQVEETSAQCRSALKPNTHAAARFAQDSKRRRGVSFTVSCCFFFLYYMCQYLILILFKTLQVLTVDPANKALDVE